MPELPFLQAMAVAALAAVALAIAAFPAGARVGAKAGWFVLRVSLVGVVLALAACLLWGASSGDLQRFNVRLGTEAWLQMGLFFAIVYGTTYRFASAYLTDKAKEAADA
jgi:lysylphosphatidylglycerol synthetase-like protein (DUF2156 family)